jgi:hypothetical protein
MPSTPQTVATVVLFDYLTSNGTAVPNARVSVMLNSTKPATAITPLVTLMQTQWFTTTDPNGYWQFLLPSNTNISPANTTYTVSTPDGSYDVTLGSVGPYQSTAFGTIVNVPVPLTQAANPVVGPLTVTGVLTAGSLQVAAGEPGIDTAAAGALLLGDNNATSIELGATGGTNVQGLLSAAAGASIVGGTGATLTAAGALAAGSLTVSSGSGPYAPAANLPAGSIAIRGPRPWADVRAFGAKCDALLWGDGNITNGLAVLTSAIAPFVSTDVGKLVAVTGAGVAGADLRTTIASYNSATSVNLAATAGATITNGNYYFGTDDTTAIQAAIDSFGTNAYNSQGGEVKQSGFSCITAQITVRSRVAYVGIARDASGVVAMGAFPASTALIWLGTNANLLSFGSRVQNMRVDCNNYTGSIGIYSERINEQSGVFNVLVVNWLGKGVQIAPPGAGAGAQNYSIDGLECIGSTQTPAAAVGLDINCTGQGWPWSVRDISIVPFSTAKITTGIMLTAASFILEQLHVENTTGQCIDISAANVSQIKGINAGPGVTNVINWRANCVGGSLLVEGVEGSSGFSGFAVVDLVNGVNVGPASATLAAYFVGTGAVGLQPMFTTDNAVASTFTSTDKQAALIFKATGASFGFGLKMIGDGGTTPSKTLRVHSGHFQIVNDAYTAVPVDFTDTGFLTLTGVGSGLSVAGDIRRSRQTPTETVLVSGIDATIGEHIEVTLTAARVVGAPLNPFIGQHLIFTLIQGGIGAFAVTWNAVFKKIWSDAGNATGARSSIEFAYNGTNWNQVAAQALYV